MPVFLLCPQLQVLVEAAVGTFYVFDEPLFHG